jgi:hypothetical protein
MAIQDQARIIADAEREIPQPAHLTSAHVEAETLRQAVLSHRPTANDGRAAAPTPPA